MARSLAPLIDPGSLVAAAAPEGPCGVVWPLSSPISSLLSPRLAIFNASPSFPPSPPPRSLSQDRALAAATRAPPRLLRFMASLGMLAPPPLPDDGHAITFYTGGGGDGAAAAAAAAVGGADKGAEQREHDMAMLRCV